MARSADSNASRGGRPTMADVAASAGVSRQTVSLVLGDKPGPNAHTRQNVLRAAESIGFHADTAAQLLRRARSRHLGVLFTMEHSLDPHLVEGLYAAATDFGYSIALSAMLPTRSVRQAVDELLGLRCEAIILIGLAVEAPTHLSEVARKVPVVEIGQRTATSGIDSVRTDDAEGARLATNHLVDLGHEEIVHVDGGNLPGATERREGYRAAMRSRGLARRTHVLAGDYTEESGARAARELLADGQLPSAVFAGNDLCASGLLNILVRTGVHVPHDLSVVGYDDSRTAALSYLDLTTVHQDAARMADLAVRAAVERLDEERDTRRDAVLTPTLTVRDSTAVPARDSVHPDAQLS